MSPLFLGSGGNNQNKMISVQVLCGISAIGLRSPENADLTTIAARSFNTLAKWLKRNPQLMDPDVVSSTQDSVTTLSQILAHQPVSEAVENEGMTTASLRSCEYSKNDELCINKIHD